MHIFIDEAGNLITKKDDGECFIIAGIFTENPRILKKLILRTRKAKLSPRDRKNDSEIKSSKATDKYKRYLYEHLNRIDNFQIFGLYLKIKDIPAHMRNKEGLIYLRITEELLKLGCIEKYDKINLVMDNKGLKGLTKNAFDLALTEEFGASFKNPKIFSIFHADSQKEKGIQAVDFVTHAIFQKYQRGNDIWLEMIKDKIVKIKDAKEFL
ncbi:MAG: DUF3800 domain-containing protein [bacterium]|nr:DUF3800 domain-containing protein [bacterium]